MLLFALLFASSIGIAQGTHGTLEIDSIQNKDVLLLRGVFINDAQNQDNFEILERVPQVRMIEEFIRAHSQCKVMMVWIHHQDPEYSRDFFLEE
jgi:hypothetical protein